MAKQRPAIPKAVKEEVLAEYRHRCAVCGHDDPQLHHIDEDTENNTPRNLLPLCPNCHLSDQHDPTRQIEHQRLQLFRDYKDPAILLPQFKSIFRRIAFLFRPEAELQAREIQDATDDLVAFIREMKSGAYYATKIASLLKRPVHVGILDVLDDVAATENRRLRLMSHRQQLAENRDEVIRLIVELLQYQDWRHSRNPK